MGVGVEGLHGVDLQCEVLHPGRRHITQLVQRPMHGFQYTLHAMEGADGCQDMRGIGPLRAPRFDPPTAFAGREERIQQPLGRCMGQQALTKIM